MRILHICAIPMTAEVLLKPQLQYLLDRKLVVGIACSSGQELAKLQRNGFKIHPVEIDRKISPLANFKSILQLVKLIKDNQYDLVHVHTPIAAVLGRIAAKIAGVKAIVYTSHGLPFHDLSSPFEYNFYSIVEKLTASITDLILSQNREDITTATKIGMCPPEKLGYLGNGIDINRFRRSRLNLAHQSNLRKSFAIPDSADLIIGTIARLTRKKGTGYLIEATAKLITEFPNLHVVIIGGELSTDPEPFQTELWERIHSLGIEKHITFTGERQDIPELLGLLDIFTLPTYTHEGLPRCILEAMAMELPVIATNIRGCREAVLDAQTGLIVPPKDTDSLAQALRKLMSNPELRNTYGQAGRQRVEAEYNEDFVFERLTQYYKQLGVSIPENNLICT